MDNINSNKEFISKIDELKDNLMDLSEENIFLNFNWTKTTVPIIDVDFFDLFSKLVIEKKIYEFTSELKIEDINKKLETEQNRVIKSKLKNTLKRIENFKNPDDLEYYSQNTLSLFKNPEFYINRNEDLVLNTPYNKNDLFNRLDLINLKYKKYMIQEGIATLYLALGFTEYKKSYAPLILIPVGLKKINNKYQLFFNNFDKVKLNEYLNIKLEKNNIKLPKKEIKTELDMISYLTDVNELVTVKPMVTLSLFNFKNIELYNDLSLDNWTDDAKNELNSLLFNKNSKPVNIISDEDVERINDKQRFRVYDADLSQSSAIEEAKLGGNLVIDAYAGTNKSQTIINLICELIANKKSVLYVSQKMNEIKNIEEEFNELGLDSVYLNLFGDNYNNFQLLEELDKTINYSYGDLNFNREFYDNEADKFNSIKNKLNSYSNFIQNPYNNSGFSPYDLLGIKETNLRQIEKLGYDIKEIGMNNVSNLTNNDIDNIFSQMFEFTKFYSKNITSTNKHKFNYIVSQDLSDKEFVKITENISKLKTSLNELIELDNQLNETYGIEKLKKLSDYGIYKENTEILYKNPQIMGDDLDAIKEYVGLLDDYQIKLNDYGSIDELEKYLSLEVYNSKIDLNEHLELIHETNENISKLISLLDNLKTQIKDAGIKELNSINEVQSSLNYLDVLDKNPSLIKDETELNVFVEDVEKYQEEYNKNTPEYLLDSINNNSIKLYDDSINKLDNLISNKQNIQEVNDLIVKINNLKKEIGINNLNSINDFSDDLSNCEVLLEDPKIIEDEEELKRFYNDYKKGYDKFSKLSHDEYYDIMNEGVNKIQDDIADELSKSNVLESNLPIIISEIRSILDNNKKLAGNVYTEDITSLKQIDEYLDNIQLLLKKPKIIKSEDKSAVNGYVSLLTDFKNNEGYTKLSLNDINDAISEIINIKNLLNKLNFEASVFDLDLETMTNKLEGLQIQLRNLPIAPPLDDKTLKSKFNEYKNSKFKLIKSFTSNYGNIKTELKSYYRNSAPNKDETIIKDYEQFFMLVDQFNDYRNKILKYYNGSEDDLSIVYIVGELKESKKSYNFICDEFEDYLRNREFNNVLSQLVLYKLKLSELDDLSNMDSMLSKYFPNTYFQKVTDLNELYGEYCDNEEFKKLIDDGFFPKDMETKIRTLDVQEISQVSDEIKQSSSKLNYYITLINKNTDLKDSILNLESVFGVDLEELSIYCRDLLDEIKKSNDLFAESLDNYNINEIDELIKDYKELNSLEKIKSFIIIDNFEAPLNDYKKEYRELCDYNEIYDNNKEIIDNYYQSIWDGRKTPTDSITKRFNICKKFTNLFNEGFFSEDVLTFLNKSPEVIKNQITDLNDSCGDLTQKVSLFKNELTFYSDDLSKIKLNEFNIQNNSILSTTDLISNYKNNLSSYNKNNLINQEVSLIDSTKNMDELSDDLNKLYNDSKITKYKISFDDEKNQLLLINNTIVKYKNLVSLRDSINDRKELINNHFTSQTSEYNIWTGPISPLDELKNKSKIDKEFSKLYADNFFTDDTISLIDNNPSIFKGFSDNIKEIHSQLQLLISKLNDNPLIIYDLTGEFKDLDFTTMNDRIVNIQSDLNNLEEDFSSVKSSKTFDSEENANNIRYLENIITSDYVKSLDINQNMLNSHLDNLKLKTYQLNELMDIKNKFDGISIDSKYFNNIWQGYDTPITQLNQQIEIDLKYEKLIETGYYNDKINVIFESEGNFDEFSSKNLNKQKLIDDCLEYVESIDLIHNDKGLNNDNDLDEVLKYVEYLNNNMDDLKNWRKMQKYCKDYDNDCTHNFIKSVYEDKIELDILMETFNYNFADNFLNEIIVENDLVTVDEIEEFKQLDAELIKLNRMKLLNVLSESKPIITDISEMDDQQLAQYRGYSKLLNQYNQKNPDSIKEILKNSFDYIKCLKPVFIMNPMSVAQYLDSSTFESSFDYIIYDDLNSSNVESSITSLLRAKNKIIIGDIKQSDDSGILSLCHSQFKNRSLTWHYQSNDESLIDFSNKEFYNEELLVYPSSYNNVFSIENNLVEDAIYNPKTKYNEVEAENIVEYALNHFEKYGDEKTLGIIALTKSQKDLIISTLINRLYNSYPHLVDYFNPIDKFFIKDIEHVDETKDIILVSLTYGLDKDNKFNNYFNLNNPNIINQILTKSHEKTVIFSNIKSENIEINEETPQNIQTLKSLLKYIEKGQSLKEEKHISDEFTQSIFEFLKDKGYNVEKQIGSCGTFIDLAVIGDDGNYVLAIECDGINYNKFKSSLDRIKLHQILLNKSGWDYYHINAFEWLKSRKDAQNNLVDAVNNAINNNSSDVIDVDIDESIEIDLDDDLVIGDDDIEIEIEDVIELDVNKNKISIDNLIELFTD